MADAASGSRNRPLGIQTGAPPLEDFAFERLWQAFMTARVGIALALLFVHGAIYALTRANAAGWVVALCSAYLVFTLVLRLARRPARNGASFGLHWLSTLAVDVLMFSALELMQVGSINYTPLFALPVLLSSVLGSLRLAVGTAAGVTLLLLTNAGWLGYVNRVDVAAQLLQAGLTGAACFMLALLVHQVAARLGRQEQQALRSERAARLQRQVNELVIEALTDGVLVVDATGLVRGANPAARRLMGPDDSAPPAPFHLGTHVGWSGLRDLVELTFSRNEGQRMDLNIHHLGENARSVQARTRLAATPGGVDESLCVVFLQDLRETEARLRTEKLAAMGRMSTAVAHEIRNPLAAIAQANQLLGEDLHDPAHRRLSQMVSQNAQRLGKIVEEVLDIARVKHEAGSGPLAEVMLDEAVAAICADWTRPDGHTDLLQLQLQAPQLRVHFDSEHLRRVLINLLDNARRYAGARPGAIRVQTFISPAGRGILKVWSAGEPLEKTVQQHLFEPFFSSESRSSGLGLYICRELCERHQAFITYQRTRHDSRDIDSEAGNEFSVAFQTDATLTRIAAPPAAHASMS